MGEMKPGGSSQDSNEHLTAVIDVDQVQEELHRSAQSIVDSVLIGIKPQIDWGLTAPAP